MLGFLICCLLVSVLFRLLRLWVLMTMVTGLWSVGDLANGASATLQLVAQILASNTTLTNLANGSSDIYDWNLTNNNGSASVTVPPAADIAVTKDVNNTAPNYRDNVTFTVIVRNDGPDDATGVSLDDLLPAGLSWVSDDSSGAYDHTTGVWTIGSLADGASAYFEYCGPGFRTQYHYRQCG